MNPKIVITTLATEIPEARFCIATNKADEIVEMWVSPSDAVVWDKLQINTMRDRVIQTVDKMDLDAIFLIRVRACPVIVSDG